MKCRTYVIRTLEILAPILFLVWFFGVRFKRLPEWSRDVYPFVYWPLLGTVVILAIGYAILSIVYAVNTRVRK
jgi:hypothetical protein